MSKIIYRCPNKKCFFHIHPLTTEVRYDGEMFCNQCRSIMVIEYEQDKGWLELIAENGENWIEDAENIYPSIIAYEYARLHTLCREHDAFAALLSIRDNFEALLKFYILLACAWGNEYGGDVFIQEALSQLMTPNLSLGAWLQIASIIINNLKETKQNLPDSIPLKQLKKLFEKKQIVNWRNEKIGHGAMGFSEDKEFIEDIQHRILDLKELLLCVDTSLRNMDLFFMPDETAGLTDLERTEKHLSHLVGVKQAHALHSNGKIYCCLSREQKKIVCLDPFIVVRQHDKQGKGVYFFDNQRTSNLTHFLSHPGGKRNVETIYYFTWLRKLLDRKGVNKNVATNDQYLSPEEHRMLNMIQMSHDYVKPDYLKKWLLNCVNNNKKGIFFLKMPRGTGKSVFTERLNRLNHNPETISDDIDVRTYHFGKGQASGVNDFRTSIQSQWKNEYGRQSWEQVRSISDFENQGLKPAEALCSFLEEIQKYSLRNRGKSQLLLVLDGLDEILDETLWDYIPQEDMLNDGIFFLLTSRKIEENLPASIERHLSSIESTEVMEVNADSEENRGFLKKYLARIKLNDTHDKLFEELASIAEYRVLYFGLLCKLIENGLALTDLPHGSKVVETYLDVLEKSYGEKETIRIREIIAILCTLGSFEPLSMKDLSIILGENDITLETVGILTDLKPLLRIERGNKGSLFSLANSDLENQFAHQIPEIEDIVRWLVEVCISVIEDGKIDHDSGMQLVATYIVEIALKWLPEGIGVFNDSLVELLLKPINNIETKPQDKNTMILWCKYYRQICIYRREKYGENDGLYMVTTIRLSKMYMEAGLFKKALLIQEKAYHTIASNPEDYQDDYYLRYSVIINFADSLGMMGRYRESLELIRDLLIDFSSVFPENHETILVLKNNYASTLGKLGYKDKAISLLYALYNYCKEELGEDSELTVIVYNNLSGFMKEQGYIKRALEMQKSIYEKRKRIYGEDHIKTLTSKMNYAQTLIDVGGSKDKAYQLMNDAYYLGKKRYSDNHPAVVVMKDNLGSLLRSMGRFEEATTLQKEAIKDSLEMPDDHLDILITKRNLAQTLNDQKKYAEALDIYLDVYGKVCQTFGDNSPEAIDDQIFLAYAYDKAGFHDKALQHCHEIAQKGIIVLDSNYETKSELLDDVVILLMDFDMYQEAMSYLERICPKSEDLFGKNSIITLKRKSYLGYINDRLGNYEKSIDILRKVYNQQRNLTGASDEEKLFTLKSLIYSYIHLGNYNSAYTFLEELCKKEIKEKNADLYCGMLLMSFVLSKLNKYDKAIDQYKEAESLKASVNYWGESRETLLIQEKLVESLMDGSYYEEALSILSNIVPECYKVLKEDDLTLLSLILQATLLRKINKNQDAVPVIEQFLSMNDKKYGRENSQRVNAMILMAKCYQDMGMKDKVEILKKEMKAILLTIEDPDGILMKKIDAINISTKNNIDN